MPLNAFTDDERAKLALLSDGGGRIERLLTIMSVTLVLDGNEQLIAFDPAQTPLSAGFTVNVGGTVTVNADIYIQLSLALGIDKSGGAGFNFSIWIEIKPILTGVWELATELMTNPIVFNDGGYAVSFRSGLNAVTGDEFRVITKENSGVGSFVSTSQVVALGTINQYAAVLSAHAVGPVTP